MTNYPPPAEELRYLDRELGHLDARRAQLLARRTWLVAAAIGQAAAASPSAGVPVGGAAGRRPEARASGVQNTLLVLGGVLLTVAAIAFTLVSWGRMGIVGRSLVLGAVTVAALGAPVVLLRRGLRSTAETVAGIGLALTVLDAYALHRVALPGVPGTEWTAASAAALGALWAGYGLRWRALRLPLPAAVLVVQPALPLWALASATDFPVVAGAIVVTSAFGAALALRATVPALRTTAAVAALTSGLCAVLASGWQAWSATSGPDIAAGAVLPASLAVLAVAVARSPVRPGVSLTGALAGGLLAVAALGVVPAKALPGDWPAVGWLLCALTLGAAVLLPGTSPLPPGPVRRGLLLASGIVSAGTALWAAPVVAVGLVGPVRNTEDLWSGAGADPLPSPLDARLPDPLVVLLVLGALAAALYGYAALARRRGGHGTSSSLGAPVLAWSAALVLPLTLRLPYWAAVAAYLVLTTALLALARFVRPATAPGPAPAVPPLPHPAPALAVLTSLSTAFLALAAEGATLTVLALLTALFGGTCAALRSGPGPAPTAAPVAAVAAFAYGTGLLGAVAASLELGPTGTALLLLVAPTAAAVLAGWLGDDPLTPAVEITGVVAAVVAVGVAIPLAPALALVLGLCGVLAGATALRSGRRSAGYAAAALFLLAAWVRLAAWEVGTPEAYTLPVTVPALVVGLLRRRSPGTTSWAAYGPGLAATLLPSLAMAWSDPGWPRPLLLGAAALAVTLLGARHRLQAPLTLGGATLGLVALHELAPHLIQLAGVLPRWLAPALAGLLLLAVGATYEHRLRDVRRAKDALGRLG
ncbi:SCO7613 C-terminal domain-containing membrane protein [Streptomyces uncialis]|uniref:SCO7613 C-terminal domain-containing membrane protein n=1 Tax=Streptomyces uncialis TaxID=1048205 RepID=UPI0033DB7E40